MTVGYHRRCDASVVIDHACQREGIATGTRSRQTFCGTGVDAAVSSLALEQLTPLAIEAALEVSAELVNRASEADTIRAAGVERARHAAEAARRRYLAVDLHADRSLRPGPARRSLPLDPSRRVAPASPPGPRNLW